MAEPTTGARDGASEPPDAMAARLTRGVSRGDRAAAEELCRGWFDGVYRMARAATRRDESFCLDVVQDVMMRVVKSMKPLGGERELKAWMGKATISCAIDALRRERRRAGRERAVATGRAEGAAEIDERIEWLRGELGRMGTEERTLVEMRFRGRTLEEAGASAGISGDAAHGRLRRTVRALMMSAKEMFS